MGKIMVGRSLLVAGLCGLLVSLGCDKATSNDPGEVGVARFELVNVPTDVRCVRLTATTAGAPIAQPLFDVTPGASSVLSIGGLPAGTVTFSGDAVPTACASITANTRPTWQATPVTATIAAGATVNVTLVMMPLATANVTVDFRDGGAPGGSGGTGGGAGGAGGTGGGAPCVDGTFTPLTLINGWAVTPYSTAAPAISLDCSGIVRFKGAIYSATGTSVQPFVIPAGLRPPTAVYVPVDMYQAAKGRLNITPDGVVSVQGYGGSTDATQFTSLEGASYALSATGFTTLTLNTGWTHAPFSTRNAAVSVSNGIVNLQGAIATTGTTTAAFTLPAGFRPSSDIYVSADMYGAAPGRLYITTAGLVTVQPAVNATDATQFTSLEGVWFPLAGTGYTALTLNTGWTQSPYATRTTAAAVSGGLVRFQGAISNGTSTSLFTLPVGMRPAASVYTPVNLCSGKKGRLFITTAGAVSVSVGSATAGTGTMADATCFISLEGVSFGL